jgi:hypothetical protein
VTWYRPGDRSKFCATRILAPAPPISRHEVRPVRATRPTANSQSPSYFQPPHLANTSPNWSRSLGSSNDGSASRFNDLVVASLRNAIPGLGKPVRSARDWLAKESADDGFRRPLPTNTIGVCFTFHPGSPPGLAVLLAVPQPTGPFQECTHDLPH